MQTLDRYHNTHTELRQMIDDLRVLLTTENLRVRTNVHAAYDQLCDLSDRVQRYLTEADHRLYPTLLIHDDPRVKSIAWGFISGERPLRKMFSDYYDTWLKNCDFNFCDDCVDQAQQVFEMMTIHLDREEEVLFPKMKEIGMLREARA